MPFETCGIVEVADASSTFGELAAFAHQARMREPSFRHRPLFGRWHHILKLQSTDILNFNFDPISFGTHITFVCEG